MQKIMGGERESLDQRRGANERKEGRMEGGGERQKKREDEKDMCERWRQLSSPGFAGLPDSPH
jgi:hypothetical protein